MTVAYTVISAPSAVNPQFGVSRTCAWGCHSGGIGDPARNKPTSSTNPAPVGLGGWTASERSPRRCHIGLCSQPESWHRACCRIVTMPQDLGRAAPKRLDEREHMQLVGGSLGASDDRSAQSGVSCRNNSGTLQRIRVLPKSERTDRHFAVEFFGRPSGSGQSSSSEGTRPRSSA
jgi:hypothetical protein